MKIKILEVIDDDSNNPVKYAEAVAGEKIEKEDVERAMSALSLDAYARSAETVAAALCRDGAYWLAESQYFCVIEVDAPPRRNRRAR